MSRPSDVADLPGLRRARPVRGRKLLRWTLFGAALLGCGLALVAERDQVADAFSQLRPIVVAQALVFVTVGTACTLLAWRALLADFGSPLPLRPAARIFFLAQLGKYLPGSVWPVLAQMDLGRDHGVPPRRSATVAVLSMALSVGTALVVAAGLLPFGAAEALWRYGWALAVVPLLVVALHPRVLTPLLNWVFRALGRPPLEQSPTVRGIGAASGWMLLAWVAYGAQLALLVRALGGTGLSAALTSAGAFALAWAVGFLVVVAPAGAGVREAVLVLALAPVLPAGSALLVALVSRVLFTVTDLGLAGAAAVAERRRSGRRS
jgi:glycosyltransferase 2 family protein